MSQNEIEQVELSIEAAQEMVARGRAAERLALVPEFKRLVLDGYFRDEAARLAHLLSDPNISEEIRAHVNRDLLGLGAFKRYLHVLVQLGHRAENEIEEARDALEEMRAEEGAE